MRASVTWAPVAALAAAALVKAASRATYYGRIVVEDGPAEDLTFLAYLGAAGVALAVARRSRRAGLAALAAAYGVGALALLGVAGEELSWGQRQLGLVTPEVLAERNIQGELNAHNVLSTVGLHLAYLAAGLAAVLARPVLRRLAPSSRVVGLVAPPAHLAGWFLPVVAFYGWSTFVSRSLGDRWQRWLGPFGYGDGAYLRNVDQELPELLFAVGVLLTLLGTAHRLRAYAYASSAAGAAGAAPTVPVPDWRSAAAGSRPSTRSSHSTALG